MSAVIRVKRRCDEEPLDALILNCKRRKTDDSTLEETSTDSLSTVLKFAGTVNNQEDDIFKHIKKPTKSEIEESYKKHYPNIRDKLKDEIKNSSKANRFKVVNLCRPNLDESATAENQESLTIVDIEANNENTQDDPKYVYDVYYTNSDDLGDFYDHDLVSIYPLNDDLVYGSHRDNGFEPTSDDNESEDSNDENNWRNDYPDEEDNDSITEADMVRAIKRVGLEDENSLSSDAEEGFIYSIDSEQAGFEEDIDDTDVNRYGERYARFKARNKEDKSSDFCEVYDDDDSANYYY